MASPVVSTRTNAADGLPGIPEFGGHHTPRFAGVLRSEFRVLGWHDAPDTGHRAGLQRPLHSRSRSG